MTQTARGAPALEQALAALDPRFARRPAGELQRGLPGDAAALLALAVASGLEPDERRLAALELLGEVLANKGPPSSSVAARLATLAGNDANAGVRREAARALARSRHEPFVAAFMARLAAPDPALAAAAAYTMGVARWSPALPHLIELFAKTSDLRVRAEAAWALGELGEAQALDVLEAALRAEIMPLTPTVDALGKLGSKDTAALLLVVLRHGHAAVRRAVAEALLRIMTRHSAATFESFAAHLLAAYTTENDPATLVWLYAAATHLGAHLDPAPLAAALGLAPTQAEPQTLLSMLLARR